MIRIWFSNSSVYHLKWLCHNVFILYIVFALLKINEIFDLDTRFAIPSLATDRFSSDLIRLSVKLTKSMVFFQVNLFVSNLNRKFSC
jgi:hypothetical protein